MIILHRFHHSKSNNRQISLLKMVTIKFILFAMRDSSHFIRLIVANDLNRIICFSCKKNITGYEQYQIFVEPKGNNLLSADKWKEDFLLQIESRGIPTKTFDVLKISGGMPNDT